MQPKHQHAAVLRVVPAMKGAVVHFRLARDGAEWGFLSLLYRHEEANCSEQKLDWDTDLQWEVPEVQDENEEQPMSPWLVGGSAATQGGGAGCLCRHVNRNSHASSTVPYS